MITMITMATILNMIMITTNQSETEKERQAQLHAKAVLFVLSNVLAKNFKKAAK